MTLEKKIHFEHVKCCVCGNTDEGKFIIKYRKENCQVAMCQNCSFLFIPSYFRKDISYTNYKDEAVANQVRQGNNWLKIQRHLLRYDLIKKYAKSGSLFDLGVGWGHFLLAGQQLGYDVYGIEISEQPYLYSKNDLKLPVDHINFFDMPETRKFDIVTMWDVLEHIDEADKVIEKCSRITKKGGHIFIQVPQIDSYIAKKYKENWKMMGLDHVNYFSKKTITLLLEKNGYKVKTIKSSIELKLLLIYTILPAIKKIKRKFSKNKAAGPAAINSAERQAYFNQVTSKPMWMLKLFVVIHNII
jgi:2-polyprenyl-3-methyl-5-hydroxy-6-metoxy-1,4-benzoquinol methylase